MRRAAAAGVLVLAACGTSDRGASTAPAGSPSAPDPASCCVSSGTDDPRGAAYLLEDGRGVAIDRSGRRVLLPAGVLVAAASDGSAYVATAEGDLVTVRRGVVSRRVHVGGAPAALVVDRAGTAYIADQVVGRVSIVRTGGTVTVARIGSRATDLAAAPDGTVYAVADAPDLVTAIRPDGTTRVVATAPRGHTGGSIAVAGDGTVYATAATGTGPGVVAVIAPGRPARLLHDPSFPGAVAVRGDGTALVGSGPGVRVLGGATIRLDRRAAVLVVDKTHAWAASSRSVWSLDGTPKKIFDVPDDNDGPPTLAVAPAGTQYPGALYIGTEHALVIIDPSGARHVLSDDPRVHGIAFAR